MEAANRRPQLPALSYLDIDKVKREEEAYQHRNTGAPPQTLPPVTAPSPTYSYPSGPPPPYSQPAPPSSHYVNAWPAPQSGVNTPPESRRTSGEDADAKQMTRQSLPSISEALGVDSQTSYATTTPAPPPPVSAHQTQSTSSPTSTTQRSTGMEAPPAPQNAYPVNGTYPPYSQHRHDTPAQLSYAPHDLSRPTYAPAQDRPPLHLQTPAPTARPSHPSSTYSYPPRSPSAREQPASQTGGSMGPPSFPYGYAPYPPRYAEPTPPSSVVGGPIYQPSANYPAPQTPTSSWKSDGSSRYGADARPNGAADYSASVKRHLDLYDLEGALNEISQTSSIMQDFSRRYGDRLHQTVRSGPTLSTLPGLIEVDDMIAKSRLQLDSLSKIRDVIITEQAAYEQQAADQRQQHKALVESSGSSNGEHLQEAEDSKAGFAGSDTKKRRGRAAPPGRCHSCNRAETPEWRRGPDGARTLCNACGLHYAKLTRKQQGANKSTSVGSSNLRPKES